MLSHGFLIHKSWNEGRATPKVYFLKEGFRFCINIQLARDLSADLRVQRASFSKVRLPHSELSAILACWSCLETLDNLKVCPLIFTTDVSLPSPARAMGWGSEKGGSIKSSIRLTDETTRPGTSLSSTRVESFHHQRYCSMHLDAQILKSSWLHEPIIHHEYNTGFTRNGRVRVLLGQKKEEDLECGRGLGWEGMVGRPGWASRWWASLDEQGERGENSQEANVEDKCELGLRCESCK